MNAPTRPPLDTIGRSVPEWIGATPDTPVPKRVKLRVFERYNGVCYLSGRKIRPGDAWDVEHVRALSLRGENRESNLRPALKEAHKAKTADDVKAKAKADRVRAKHLGVWPKSKRPLKSRGFGNSRLSTRDVLIMAVGFGIAVGGLGGLYVAGQTAAREAHYSERPPERYLTNTAPVPWIAGDSIQAVDAMCRARGVRRSGFLYGCGFPAGHVVLPNPCGYRDAAAKAVCAGAPLTVAVCRERGFWAELCLHEIGHWAGWPADHRRDW